MKKTFQSLLYLAIIGLVPFFSTVPIAAIAEDDLRAINLEATIFYGDDGFRCTIDGDGIVVPSGWQVGQEALDRVEEHMPVYSMVSEETGVPTAIFAVLHYRESSLNLRWPANGQGIYQFLTASFPTSGNLNQQDFISQTNFAADGIINDYMNRAKQRLDSMGESPPEFSSDNPESIAAAFSDEKFVKAFFFAYNGWASAYVNQAETLGFANEPWEGSPYVMNLWDAQRNGSNTPYGTWGQVKQDGGPIVYPANDQPGSFLLYAAFGGAASITGPCDPSVLSGSVEALIHIAQQELARNPQQWDENVLNYTTGRQEPWCADFVSWVFQQADMPFTGGPFHDWQIPAVLGMQAWYRQHGEYFEVGDKEPQPGDVAFYIGAQTPDGGSTRHVNIVIDVEGDTMTTIGGNESNTVKLSTRKISRGSQSLVGFGRRN